MTTASLERTKKLGLWDTFRTVSEILSAVDMGRRPELKSDEFLRWIAMVIEI